MRSQRARTSGLKIPHIKWVIAMLLFAATMINYADRLTLSVVSHDMRRRIRPHRAGLLGSRHAVPVRLRHHVRGLGLRGRPARDATRIRCIHLRLVSGADAARRLSRGKWSLGACRFLLGLGEPGNWPAAAKAVAEWFPARQRALGVGIFNAGSSIGSAIAPPVVAYLTYRYGWRVGFRLYRRCWALSGWLPLAGALRSAAQESLAAARTRCRIWMKCSRRRSTQPAELARSDHACAQCYTLILARFFTDPVIYFVIFWLPEYLRKERALRSRDGRQVRLGAVHFRRYRLRAGRLAFRPADAGRLDAAAMRANSSCCSAPRACRLRSSRRWSRRLAGHRRDVFPDLRTRASG